MKIQSIQAKILVVAILAMPWVNISSRSAVAAENIRYSLEKPTGLEVDYSRPVIVANTDPVLVVGAGGVTEGSLWAAYRVRLLEAPGGTSSSVTYYEYLTVYKATEVQKETVRFDRDEQFPSGRPAEKGDVLFPTRENAAAHLKGVQTTYFAPSEKVAKVSERGFFDFSGRTFFPEVGKRSIHNLDFAYKHIFLAAMFGARLGVGYIGGLYGRSKAIDATNFAYTEASAGPDDGTFSIAPGVIAGASQDGIVGGLSLRARGGYPDQTHLDVLGRWVYSVGLEAEVSGELNFTDSVGGRIATGFTNFPGQDGNMFTWSVGPRVRVSDYAFMSATAGLAVSDRQQVGPVFSIGLRYILPGNEEVVGQSSLR